METTPKRKTSFFHIRFSTDREPVGGEIWRFRSDFTLSGEGGLLLFSYYFFVSRTAEWLEQPILGTAAEIIFKLVLFTFATLLCSMIAIACIRYLNQEKVVVTKYRLVTIIFTAIGGGAFFFTKTVLALSYLWHPFGADWINRYTKLSLHSAAMAGCTAVLLWTAPLIGVIIAVFALLVGWARIRLKHHTPLQILIGWILAALNDSSDDVDDFTYAMYGTDIPEDLLGDE